jgi:hypothetical protein
MKTSDKFPLSPIHDKKAIIEILNNFNIIQMCNLTEYIGVISEEANKSDLKYCASCFTEISPSHFERRAYHDSEHCPKCNNDLLGNRWYNPVISKGAMNLIKMALKHYPIV